MKMYFVIFEETEKIGQQKHKFDGCFFFVSAASRWKKDNMFTKHMSMCVYVGKSLNTQVQV